MTRTARPPILLALLALAALLLSGCASTDRQQAMICVAVATAIGPENKAISIQSVEPLTGIDHAVRVMFRAAGDPRQFFADCAFAGGTLSGGRRDVVAVRGFDGRLSDIRLETLKRWFLDRPGAVDAAIAETDWTPPGVALLDVRPSASVGYALQQLTNLLNVAAFYMPLALAYALIYGLIGRINMAFGEIAMIGAFGAVFGIVTAIGAHAIRIDTILLFSVMVGISLASLCGWLVARTVVLPLANAPSRPFIVATVGLALVLSEGVRLAQGSREIWLPPILETPVTLTGGPFPVMVTQMRLLIFAISAVLLPCLLVFMRRSSFGRAWRAVADDALMARLSGIDPIAVTGVTFMLAAGLAGGAGTILALSYGGTSYSAGMLLGLKALLASLVGGAGSLGGALAGAFLLATIETGWAAYFGSGERDIVVLSVVTILFVLRPNGLIGRKRALEEGRIIRLS